MSAPMLFPDAELLRRFPRDRGVLPSQAIRELIEAGVVFAEAGIDEDQVQPASVDLRLGRRAFRIPASFLPGRRRTVAQILDEAAMYDFDLRDGGVLETGCVYIVEVQEGLRLPRGISALATPKSSTGRLDIFTRLIADGTSEFERVPERYEGRLYVEISPRSFSVLVREGTKLNQLRFRRGETTASDTALAREHEESPLVGAGEAARFGGGLRFSVDLRGREPGTTVVYRARRHAREVIDLARLASYDPADFWDPVPGPLTNGLVLYPDEFYILATVEPVRVPPHLSAEMVAYDTNIGEFRVHYAGFFDPGFGWDEANDQGGTPAVLEVRAHEIPFLLEHGQQVGRLAYEYLLERPDKIYGVGIGSNYARQGLTLAKQFRRG